MAPLDFLAVVLPSPGHGYYCVAELTTPKKAHVFKDTLKALAPTIERHNNAGRDLYFALSTFADPDNGRTAANAQYVKALFIDIDCNHKLDIPGKNGEIKPKEYPSAKAAVAALVAFLQETGLDTLGAPWLASSGGGVHAYWPLTEEVAVEDWRPVAENFKTLCRQHKLGIDMTVTADAARVMRMPGSRNNGVKGSTQTRGATFAELRSQGAVFALEDIAKIVRGQLVGKTFEQKQPPKALALPGTRPGAGPGTLGQKLAGDNMAQSSFTRLVKRTAKGLGCAQLANYMENAEKDGMEPLWRGVLSWAKCCEQDGWKSAQKISALHPYPPERLQAKWQEIKGPYSCAKMDSENPGGCDGCPHQGKITNPLALCRTVLEDAPHKEVILDKTTKPSPATRPPRMEPAPLPKTQDGSDAFDEDYAPPQSVMLRPEAPFGFGYTKGGGVFRRVRDEAGELAEVPILLHDFFVVRILRNQQEHTVQFLYDTPAAARDVLIPQKAVVSTEETLKVLASHNVMSVGGGGNDKHLHAYVRACVDQATKNSFILRTPDHCGWQEDDTYAHGGKIYAPHRSPLVLPMPGLENLTNAMQPTGTMDNWRRFIDLLIRKELYDILAMVLISAGAPLMRFTGISGLTFHFTSRNSGTGKSLGLDAAASVWGVPKKYRVSRDTSAVAMQQRLGLLNSEPLITDEITQKNRNADMEWLPSFLFDMSEGKGKERMEGSANKERVNTTYWHSVAMLTSNNPAVDYLTGTRAHSSEGELRRLLELVMEQHLSWEADELETMKSLGDNSGHLAAPYIQHMVDNVESVRKLTNETTSALYQRLKASSDERFWMAGIGAAMTAGLLLSKEHTGLLPLPLKGILKVFSKMLHDMREHTRAGARSAEDILNTFVRENYGNFVSVTYIDRKPQIDGGRGDMADSSKSLARMKIMGRVERGLTDGLIDVYIEERVMRAYCASKSYGYNDFRKQLEQVYPVKYVRKNMTVKTQGPEMRVNALCITQPDNDLETVLAEASE